METLCSHLKLDTKTAKNLQSLSEHPLHGIYIKPHQAPRSICFYLKLLGIPFRGQLMVLPKYHIVDSLLPSNMGQSEWISLGWATGNLFNNNCSLGFQLFLWIWCTPTSVLNSSNSQNWYFLGKSLLISGSSKIGHYHQTSNHNKPL